MREDYDLFVNVSVPGIKDASNCSADEKPLSDILKVKRILDTIISLSQSVAPCSRIEC